MTLTSRQKRRVKNKIIRFFVLALIAIALIALQESVRGASSYRSDKNMMVWFFDVGQGDSAFIETPDGAQILIDAGPDDKILSKLGAVMPFWDRTIDAVIMTHPDADHVGGFPSVFDRFKIENIYITDAKKETALFDEVLKSIEKENASVFVVREKSLVEFDSDVSLRFLHPDRNVVPNNAETNDWSIVNILSYGNTGILFMGDLGENFEPRIAQIVNEDIDVLKIGHHGSKNSSSFEFLKDIDPDLAIVSVGENKYGHPHASVLSLLNNLKIRIERTDTDGDIRLISNSVTHSIEPFPLSF
ncbi:MAG: hypothetical protein ACD_76C00115G0002 [uncultured bacterium]|nr:MAG: hypothetical protein ACD_76C00115G0002 [uncultured bacterium]HBD05348.1 hypothetical protein [Candidatus Uhrbacteria bacterium]